MAIGLGRLDEVIDPIGGEMLAGAQIRI